MGRWKVVAVVLVVVGGCVAGAWYALGQLRASIGCSIIVDCEQLPPDDDALEQWLKSQPGVVERTARVHRNGKSVGISWIMVQSIRPREPRTPDFEAMFPKLGYHGTGPIRDARPSKP